MHAAETRDNKGSSAAAGDRYEQKLARIRKAWPWLLGAAVLLPPNLVAFIILACGVMYVLSVAAARLVVDRDRRRTGDSL